MAENYHEVIAELRERIAWLEEELGVAGRTEQVALLQAKKLTPSEARIVLSLYNAKRAVPYHTLFDHIEHSHDGTDLKIVQVYMHRIRQKIGSDAIATVYSIGYRLTPLGHSIVAGLLGVQPLSTMVA